MCQQNSKGPETKKQNNLNHKQKISLETKKLIRAIDSSIKKKNITTWTKVVTTKKYYTIKFKRKTLQNQIMTKIKKKKVTILGDSIKSSWILPNELN